MNPITDLLIAVAKQHAAADTQHGYTRVDDFQPHDWVVAAMRAAYEAGLADARPRVSPEPRDSDLHAAAPGQHHEIALAVWEHMNRRSAPGVIMTMAYTAVLHALSKPAPTVEQAGEVLRGRMVTDEMVRRADKAYWDEQAKNWASEDDLRFMRAALEDIFAQPRPVGVPDGLADPDNPWRRAVEHAGYLVTTINRYMEAKGEAHVAFEQVEGVEDPTDEAIAELESAQETEHELWVAMRNDVYEFTKRRDRALATLAAAPAPGKGGEA